MAIKQGSAGGEKKKTADHTDGADNEGSGNQGSGNQEGKARIPDLLIKTD
jgi:hypothetical protein